MRDIRRSYERRRTEKDDGRVEWGIEWGEKIFDEIYRFPEELSEKQLRRVIASYADGVKPEEVLERLFAGCKAQTESKEIVAVHNELADRQKLR